VYGVGSITLLRSRYRLHPLAEGKGSNTSVTTQVNTHLYSVWDQKPCYRVEAPAPLPLACTVEPRQNTHQVDRVVVQPSGQAHAPVQQVGLSADQTPTQVGRVYYPQKG
jgi:hypothetical protein